MRRKFLCLATTRRGTPCQCKAIETKHGAWRCRLHGGLSTGPTTAEGRARIAVAVRERWAKWRAARSHRCEATGVRGTGGRVLVCDDNLLIADVVAEFLREGGLKPMGPVGRLESAMHMARERALDGAILDINLNGRPCFPICAILSARRIPFMFLTGYPHAAIPVEYRWARLIAKPLEPGEMKEALAAILGLPEDWSAPEHLRHSVRHREPRPCEGPAQPLGRWAMA